jgi:hypothetical protein
MIDFLLDENRFRLAVNLFIRFENDFILFG